jgi:hypothetical protein
MPNNQLCNEIIPLLYQNSSTAKSIPISSMELIRPDGASQLAFDVSCRNVIGGKSFWAQYYYNGHPAVPYSTKACISNNNNNNNNSSCPVFGQKSYCPCVTTSSTDECKPKGCTANDESTACTSFTAGQIGACYCYNSLNAILKSNGVVSSLQKFNEQKNNNACKSYFKQYSLSVGLTYLSVVTTTAASTFMRTFLKMLSLQEAHQSSDQLEGSIMAKIWQSSYVMMAIIVLIAYGGTSNPPYILKQLHIFVGPYKDFTRAWYGNIGFYLMTTFILQSFSPLLYNLMDYFVFKPILRYYHHERVR